MKCVYTCLFVAFLSMVSFSQKKLQVLFLGNSYTEYNNLPQLVASVALSKGDTLVFDAYTPGGQTFQQHSVSGICRDKILSRKWDYVVLQEQSQLPSFSPGRVESQVLPYAAALCQQVRNNDTCSRVMFYMTWGRENGDALMCMSYSPLCTFNGMQQRLRDSYLQMAETNHAEVAPVGMVWKYIREHSPEIILYDTDGSHPGLAGSYLAACTFYASLFHKSPLGAFVPNGVSAAHADSIQAAAALVVLDSMMVWNMDTSRVYADFIFMTDSLGSTDFINQSESAATYSWDFGDGTFSSHPSPQHTYLQPGIYTVKLVASNGCKADTVSRQILFMKGAGVSSEEEGMDRRIFSDSFFPEVCVVLPVDGTFIYNMHGMQNRILSLPAGVYSDEFRNGIYYISDMKKKHEKNVKEQWLYDEI